MQQRGRSDPGLGSGPPRYPGSFLLAFREAVEQLGWRFQRLLQEVAVCVDGGGKEHPVVLENLYRRARRLPREDWPALIAEFVNTVSTAEQSDNLPVKLADVADQILLRLGQPFQRAPDEARVWSQELSGTDLVVNLVIDYPNRMCYVTEQLVADSGRSGSDWLEQARTNLMGRTPADCFQVVHEDSGLRRCGVADAYDSSRALLLDRLLPEARTLGCLAVLPGRDELLVLPVTLDVVPHVHLLKVLAEKYYRNAPYPLSNGVFWIHEGVWRRFVVEVNGDQVTVQPPDEFLELLNQLSPPGDAEDVDEAPDG